MPMHIGNWQLDTVNGGQFRLDGGVLFGVIPKIMWKGLVTVDDDNCVFLTNHCVLARDGRHTVLIDSGYGGNYGPVERECYGMDAGTPLLESLGKLNVKPSDIDTVVLSHLHFDHVGGCSILLDGHRDLTFQTAQHFVGRWEWQDAMAQRPESQSAYLMDDLQPLQSCERLMLYDDGEEIVPGLRACHTGGHTRGHMALMIRSSGKTASYLSDICPSTLHLRRLWHPAYDTHPLQTRRRKGDLLLQAADEEWIVMWNHDPKVAVSRVVKDARREFQAIECAASL